MTNRAHHPSFSEALRVWVRVALNSFGGPAGQIAVMHQYIVEEKKWLDERRFLHALNYCMLLPGPEAQQLATYIGWLLHRTKGGIVAGALFVLPGFLAILVLSILYALWKDSLFVQGLFYGIKPAVLAIVAGAVIKIGKKALKNEIMVGIAVLAFIAIFFLKIHFPYIVLVAGLLGFAGGKWFPGKFAMLQEPAKTSETNGHEAADNSRPSIAATLRTAVFWLAIWLVPVGLLAVFLGEEHIFVRETVFFSQSALVTFGGAYSVLAYISQKAVETYGWLQPGEMLDGLGMAETTPGPLIQVVQFVGFMGAFRHSGSMDPLLAGVIASFLVTWVTYLPSFFFIFTGAPYIEYLRGNRNLTSALSAITAAVVGVILNLGIWFSMHTLFREVGEKVVGPIHLPVPSFHTADAGAMVITLAALLFYFRLKWSMMRTIAVCAGLGLGVYYLAGQ